MAAAVLAVAAPFLSFTALPAQEVGLRTVTVREPIALSLETYRLPNGLNVILAPDRSVPIVAVNV